MNRGPTDEALVARLAASIGASAAAVRLVLEPAWRRTAEGRVALDAEALTRGLGELGGARPSPVALATPLPEQPAFVGRSEALRSLLAAMKRMARADAAVLISGEHGTGKELVARWLHQRSGRVGPFLARSCAALSEGLLESELFGHGRGSFTGAVRDHKGLFEQADRGTLLLDEIGATSPALQVRLLRVLQDGVVAPVGGAEPRRVDVRLLAATNVDLAALVERGGFRADLFYRINVLSLRVPPLRERSEDIDALAQHFVERACRRVGREPRPVLQPDLLAALRRYPWPGNVRELENEVERLLVLSAGARSLGAELVSPRVRVDAASRARPSAPLVGSDHRPGAGATLPEAVEALERVRIEAALVAAAGNRSRAAAALGVSRRNLLRKITRYELASAGRTERLGEAAGPAPGPEKS